ncbi:hypothetical protein HJA90_10330 [Rhizobium bangladeshense]|uniref:hypothetical protein n=1 Tax=Rhizobium bangladeshense TaxID=1138189 RepID=UPI001C82F5FE|nr:hypothetical protein [Rhizobium bangladeshense]MBX4883978.1 hypothetical protein [Rhizobium bangladeshense]
MAEITASQFAAFKSAFYNNSGDETDDPFVKAFEAIGWSVLNSEQPTGIAREVFGVKIPFVADCLRTYADVLRRGHIDTAGHYFPVDIEEAADMLEAGEAGLLEIARALVDSLAQTPERAVAWSALRIAVENA